MTIATLRLILAVLVGSTAVLFVLNSAVFTISHQPINLIAAVLCLISTCTIFMARNSL